MTIPQKPSLESTQRWLQSVITHPQGVEAGLSSEATRTHLDVAPSDVQSVVERSVNQNCVERLGIYATAYHARLIECLEAEFPVFRQTVGDETFADFAVEYLEQCPSHNYTLGHLGAAFSKFLADTKPSPAADRSMAEWPEFLVDLALLERTFAEVFDGPGIEGTQTLSADALLAIDPRRAPQARLTLVPCLRLLELRFPLNNYYTAVKHGQTPQWPQASDSWLAVTRRDYVVRRYELSHPQFVLLHALRSGQTLGEAITSAVEIYPHTLDALMTDIRDWFQTWAAAPLFDAFG